MNNGKHVILHIVFDGILFDMVFPRFEQMQEYENMYLLGSLNLDKELEYIKNKEKVIRVGSLDAWGKIVNDEKIDIIYLHGLWSDYLKAIDYIRNNVKVMWWVYGMEIYENCFGFAPLMRMEIYKTRTLQFQLNKYNSFRSRFRNRLIHKYPQIYDLLQTIKNRVSGKPNRLKRMLARIDYAFTPLPIELEELKKKNRYIHANPFRIQGTRTQEPLVSHKSVGHILLEHSANISNNHLDVIEAMENDTGMLISTLQVDGGACKNDYLMQFQSDLLQTGIMRPVNFETTALGAAMLAGLATGVFSDKNELRSNYEVERYFEPVQSAKQVQELIAGWKKAVKATMEF